MATPKSDKKEELLLTTAEAIALVKQSERIRATFCLHVRASAPVIDKPDHVFEDGLSTYLRLSRADALHLVSTMLTKTLEERGGRIRVTETESEYGGPKTYWIG